MPGQEGGVFMGTAEAVRGVAGAEGGRGTVEMGHILVVLPRPAAGYGRAQGRLEPRSLGK